MKEPPENSELAPQSALQGDLRSFRAVPKSPREQFAENLRYHRTRRGLTQEALSELCDLHRTEISLLERCKRSPRLETIATLAHSLELGAAGELLDRIR